MTKSKVRVLIVDDEAAIVEEFAEFLTDLGFACDWETSADQGLERLKQTGYSHMFLDLRMPDMDGWSLLEQLEPGMLRDLKVVVMSGHATEMDEARVHEKGIFAFMLKPIDLERVVKLLSPNEDGSNT